MKAILWLSLITAGAGLGGCIEHHVKVDPLQINIDVNVKVDRQLDNFFDFENEYKNPKDESK
ncbi:MAG: hypothetical protein GC162_11495 [Planctomycetes bacterium]|nr:hypothetical protein [Planctomycetota bacterium]